MSNVNPFNNRGRLAALLLALVGLSGCAAFNDVIVIDVGEQFRLVETSGTGVAQSVSTNGFDCTFSAVSARSSIFAREKRIDGAIRCEPIVSE